MVLSCFFRKTFIFCKLQSTIFKSRNKIYTYYQMQNHVRSMMQFRKRLCNEGLRSYGRFYAQVQLKSKDRKFTFQAFVKTNHLTHFDDWDHQNWNFVVSIMIVSIICASLTRTVFIKTCILKKCEPIFRVRGLSRHF